MRILWLLAASLVIVPGCSGTALTPSALTRIIFTSERDGRPQIYAMAADGSEPVNLSARGATRQATEDGVPACAHDGSRIAFSRAQPDGLAAVWVMDADGSSQRQVPGVDLGINGVNPRGFEPWPDARFYDLALSPDGSKIAILAFGLVTVDVAGGEPHPLSDDFSPDWSPNGEKIAVAGSRTPDLYFDIYVMNADGSHPVQLMNDPQRDGAPAWSPDGSKIAFESAGRDRKFDADIFVMNADGTGLTRLTTSAGQDTWPAWSPDGTKIAFQSDRDGKDEEVYVMQADGTGETALTSNDVNDGHPCWLRP